MLKHVIAALVLAYSALLLAGCGNRTEPGPETTPDHVAAAPSTAEPNRSAAPAEAQQVTLHVADMSERLGLT